MPFADNGAGDLLCMRIRGEPYGAIYLWDHEERFEDGVYPVNSSFEDWLRSLTLEG